MDNLSQIVSLVALVGSGLIGGVFFAFSSFVMGALARLPAPQGIAAMQSINIVVINPHFLGCFVGTAVVSLGAVVLAILRPGDPGASYMLAGGVLYVVGTFMVTGTRNVPLNNALARHASTDADALLEWELYVVRWTQWNHVRTAASLLATVCFGLALTCGG